LVIENIVVDEYNNEELVLMVDMDEYSENWLLILALIVDYINYVVVKMLNKNLLQVQHIHDHQWH